MKFSRSFILLGLACIAISGCSNVRESLGMGRAAPDEFTVIDRPPLSMPPDFGLRPPQPGASRPQDVNITQRANDVLFGGNPDAKPATTDVSDSEKAILDTVGIAKVDPDIREVIDREDSQKVVVNDHLVDDLLWWRKPEGKPVITVDAPAEAARIKEAQEKGEPLNKGATPIIDRQKPAGWLDL